LLAHYIGKIIHLFISKNRKNNLTLKKQGVLQDKFYAKDYVAIYQK